MNKPHKMPLTLMNKVPHINLEKLNVIQIDTQARNGVTGHQVQADFL